MHHVLRFYQEFVQFLKAVMGSNRPPANLYADVFSLLLYGVLLVLTSEIHKFLVAKCVIAFASCHLYSHVIDVENSIEVDASQKVVKDVEVSLVLCKMRIIDFIAL